MRPKLILSKLLLLAILNFASPLCAKTIVITGASQGIGLEIAEKFSSQGHSVWALTRTPPNKPSNIHFLQVDLTKTESIDQAISHIIEKEKNIDVLVNNAGYGQIASIENTSINEMKDLFEINFFSAVYLTQKVLPNMRESNSGHIINISSTSGIRPVPGLASYAASKFALEAFSEALSVELSPWNVFVSIIQPGSVANDWAKNSSLPSHTNTSSYYNQYDSKLREKLIHLSKNGQSMSEIASLVFRITQEEKPKLRYQTSEAVKKSVSLKLLDLDGKQYQKAFTQFYKSVVEPQSS